MTAHPEFDRLAAAADYCARTLRTEWRVDTWIEDKWVPVGDTWDTEAATQVDYAESHKYWNHADLMVWKIDPDGCATDVTRDFEYDFECDCETQEYDWTIAEENRKSDDARAALAAKYGWNG